MLEIGKVKELKDVSIQFVSYVGKGANKKKFFLTKSTETKETNFEQKVRTVIKSSDDPKKLVYGVVYEPNEEDPDTHDHFMNADEIEKAAHDFVKNFRAIDKQHDFIDGAGEMVESYITPVEFILNEEVIKEGSWILVTKATEEIWGAIEKGEYTGYSMAGFAGQVIDIEKTETVEKSEDIEIRVKKDFNEILERKENNEVSAYVRLLLDACWDVEWDFNTPEERKAEILKNIDQLKTKVSTMTFIKSEKIVDIDDSSTIEVVKTETETKDSDLELEVIKTTQTDLSESIKTANLSILDLSKKQDTNLEIIEKLNNKIVELEKAILNNTETIETKPIVAKSDIILM